ncbi:acid phosphatase [Mycobacterium hodleri]|uniref:alkaline phosphatase family protein n=1 Tax=Mycolicibacterium hodleri TaxID=49897 RepID=UPI0021F3017F|nr:alkaline phosphatase family protein [Mycolicibacterium hodleri]MCV7133214.1 acid phosphatase [Mycolicibacterium hodleri]
MLVATATKSRAAASTIGHLTPWVRFVVSLAACAACPAVPAAAAPPIPPPAHVVIVVEENHASTGIVGKESAPYMNALALNGTLLTQSYAVSHPSEPNYLAMFAGNTFGVTSDVCPLDLGAAPNLASELLAGGHTFGGFSEDLPTVGSTVCSAGKYARKHVPWVDFSNVPADASMPLSAFGARSDYASLPTVSFVIPNLGNDMHDGSITQADGWLQENLATYATWAKSNNSLLIVTWDEDDDSAGNRIPTIFYGAHVPVATDAAPLNHYNLLSTIEDLYGLPKTGLAANAPAIMNVWA